MIHSVLRLVQCWCYCLVRTLVDRGHSLLYQVVLVTQTSLNNQKTLVPLVILEADLGTLRLWLSTNYTVPIHTHGQSARSLSQRQGRVWSRLVPWDQLISSPAYTSASEWSSASFYCCSARVRKLLEVLEIWKWLIYLDKSHFPLRKEACVLPLDWSKCRFVYAEASFLSITEPHWNWWNPVT